MLSVAQLNAELTTDPVALGYAAPLASGNDQAVADLRNDKSKGFTIAVPLAISVVAEWAAPSVRGKLQAAANDPTNAAYSVALSGLDLLHGTSPTLDTVKEATFLTQLVTAGIATQAEHDALIAMAIVPASREEVQNGAGAFCTPGQISKAMGRG